MQLVTTISASLPKLIQDYLDQEGELAQCYSFPHQLNGVIAAAKARQSLKRDYTVLADVLTEQAKKSPFASQQVFQNIEKLNQGSVSVTTGHQLCVYGGPLFFFHKILSAVSLANRLKENGVDAVPVYWMASEDHDFEEINHIFIGNEKLTWETNHGGPVGKISLQNLESFKERLATIFSENPLKREALKKLDEIYSAGKTLAEATRDFVYWIFADLGVVVIDADDHRLKTEFKPVIKQEVEAQFSFQALQKSNERLTELGYGIQVEGREINLFYMTNDYRERIVVTQSGFATADGKCSWSKDEMFSEIENNPERFSPNVVLRPVYQEMILPNAAYIGGPGELSYWLQLKPVFDAVEAFYPAVLLRDMVAISTEKVEKRLEQLFISYADAKKPEDVLLTDLVRKSGSHEFIVEETYNQVLSELEAMIERLESISENLATSAKTEKKRILSRLEQLQKKTLRNDKRNAEIISKRIDDVKEVLYPLQTPQERVHNWLNYMHDAKSFSQASVDYYNLFQLGIKILSM